MLLYAHAAIWVSLHTSLLCVDITDWSWLRDQHCPPLSNGDKALILHLEKTWWCFCYSLFLCFRLDQFLLMCAQRDRHQGLILSLFLSQLTIFMVSSCDYNFLTQTKYSVFWVSGPLALRGCLKGWGSVQIFWLRGTAACASVMQCRRKCTKEHLLAHITSLSSPILPVTGTIGDET